MISNYIIEKETEKAIFISINWWLETPESEKKHQTIKCKIWCPKSIINIDKSIPKWFVLKAISEIEKKQHPSQNNSIYNQRRRERIGTEAPIKNKISFLVEDFQAKNEKGIILLKYLISKYPNLEDLRHYRYYELNLLIDNYPDELEKLDLEKIENWIKIKPNQITKFKYI